MLLRPALTRPYLYFCKKVKGKKKRRKKAICLVNKTPLNLSRTHQLTHTHTSSQRPEAGQEAPICAPIVRSSRRLAAESGVPIVELSLSSYLWLVWWSFIVLFCTVISYFLSTFFFFFLSEGTLTPEAHHYQCYDVYHHVIYCST